MENDFYQISLFCDIIPATLDLNRLSMLKLRDKKRERDFARDGFVTFPLLNGEEVKQLRDIYFHYKDRHLTQQGILHSTSDTNDYDLISQINRKITEIMTPAVDRILEDYEPLIAGFLTKEIGDVSATEFHQDPTLVDENEFVSANVWVALQDTQAANGNLRVVKGSHRLKPCIRATPDCPMAFRLIKNDLIHFATEVPVSAGEAVLLNHQTIHGATDNHSGCERIAIAMAVKPKRAEWCFYFLEKNAPHDQIEKYTIDGDAFARLIKYERPTTGTFLGHVASPFEAITRKDLIHFMLKNYPADALKGIVKMGLSSAK